MVVKDLIIGALLGGSLLLFGLGLHKWLLGAAGLLIELGAAYLYRPACWIAFLILLFLLLLLGGAGTAVAPRSAGPVFCVTGVAGPLAGKQFFLSDRKSVLEFGRENCDVQFPPDTTGVGRHHCRVILQNGQPYLEDSNSRYGTFILNPPQKLAPNQPAPLAENASFSLARKDIIFRINKKQ